MLDWSKPPNVKEGTLCFASVDGSDMLIRYNGTTWETVWCRVCLAAICKYNNETDFFICGGGHYWREGELE